MKTIEALNKLYNLSGSDTLVHVDATLREALRVMYQNHEEIYGVFPERSEAERLVVMSMNPDSQSDTMDAIVQSVIYSIDREFEA